MNKAIILLMLAQLCLAVPVSFDFEDDSDFSQGTYINTQSINDYLELSSDLDTLRYLWVANAGESSVSKIDTLTDTEVARYWTGRNEASGGHSPSRTAVDSYGNVWIGNRQGDRTAVKIAGHSSYCVDRNGNNMIDTSHESNSIPGIQTNEMLDWGEDECVLLWPDLTDSGGNGPRAVAIDLNGYVWVGLYEDRMFVKLDPNTGLEEFGISIPNNPYGAVIDGNGNLWSSNRGGDTVSQIDTNTNQHIQTVSVEPSNADLYGIAIDTYDRIWLGQARWSSPYVGGLIQVNANNPSQSTFIPIGQLTRGVTVDFDGNVWFADSGTDRIYKWVPNDNTYPTTGAVDCSVFVGGNPIGVVTDSQGFIWSMSQSDDVAHKLDPSNCNLLNTISVGDGPYTYSDATGSLLAQFIQLGTWEVTIQTTDLFAWLNITWDEWDNDDNIVVEKRRIGDPSFTVVDSGDSFFDVTDTFIVRITIFRNDDGTSPKLDNLQIGADGPLDCYDGSIDVEDQTISFDYSAYPGYNYSLENMLTDPSSAPCDLVLMSWSLAVSSNFNITVPNGPNITIVPNAPNWTTATLEILDSDVTCEASMCFEPDGDPVEGMNITFNGSAELTIIYDHVQECSNYLVEPGETCDVGPIDTEQCVGCQLTYCGDGVNQSITGNGVGTGGVADDGIEQCDDGANGDDFDFCFDNCTWTEVCGDGVVRGSEECDDADDGDLNDECIIDWGLRECMNAVCGDGYVWSNDCTNCEECDDSNVVNGDGCDSNCQRESGISFCGDGIVQRPNSNGQNETCDDGNTADGDGCSGICEAEGGPGTYCGDGLEQHPNGNSVDEECDDGNNVDGDGCDSNCQDEGTGTYCGDGTIQPINDNGQLEECDDGNAVDGDGCDSNCLVETGGNTFCGDGYEQHPNGNGFDEECDDANNLDGDGCSSNCLDEGSSKICGDGNIDLPNDNNQYEECDDGNSIPGDGCSILCQDETGTLKFCGDGFTDHPNDNGLDEQCDDANYVSGDGCDNCVLEEGHTFCGNNAINNPNDNGQFEQCDDGNTVSGDGCSSICRFEGSPGHEDYCTDGTIQKPNDNGKYEECDDGNHEPDDFCDNYCNLGAIEIIKYTLENVSFDTIDFYSLTIVQNHFGMPEKALTITVPPNPNLIYTVGINSLKVKPVDGWTGWTVVEVTLEDGPIKGIFSINFTVSDVPSFAVQPQETFLLVAKGQAVSGYYEDQVIGDVTEWGPYIIIVKVWEK